MMNCRACIAQLVECARAGLLPGSQLQGHLRACPPCRERWEGELALSAQFRKMRGAAFARRQPDAQRERIMRAFEQTRPIAVRPSLRWVLGMAAVLLLAVAISQIWRVGQHLTGPAKNPIPEEFTNSATGGAADSPTGNTTGNMGASGPGEFVSNNDFVEVPYAPPLATGEFVRIVRTELRTTALARMGIYVDAAGADEIPADVLLGEDGFPRGVRVLDALDF